MAVKNQEGRMLEVLNLPPEANQELLALYFMNRRRSGGGPLVSVEVSGGRATVVFEEAEGECGSFVEATPRPAIRVTCCSVPTDAARVLSREDLVLQNTQLRVRKAARTDRRRLLLRGLRPDTSVDHVEMYVENTLDLDLDDYQLNFTPARDSVLIQLNQPSSRDFQTLSANVSKLSLDGAPMTLEEIRETDSVWVGNLPPGTSPEMLSLFFECRSGNQPVVEVAVLSESTARVSFVNCEAVDLVLAQQHKLKGADLEVQPYFDFLQPSPPGDSQAEAAEPLRAELKLTDFIAITDPVKLQLFQLGNFETEMKEAHPDATVQVRDGGVHLEAADRDAFQRVKASVLERVCAMAETHLALEPEEAEFLDRREVKERLQPSLSRTPAAYMVLDGIAVVTALSRAAALQACGFLKSQLGRISVLMDSQYKTIFPTHEWSEFLRALPLASVTVTPEDIRILTLKGLEGEKQAAVLDFLASQIDTEAEVYMAPGVLKYIQTHCHELLVYMDQVSVVPLELDDVSGLKIYGHAVACGAAQEMLQSIVASVCSRSVSVSSLGVTRYLLEQEGKTFLSNMEEDYQLCVLVEPQLWEPLAEQDFFRAAWAQMATKNFGKVSVDAPRSQNNGGGVSDLLENAKAVISGIDGADRSLSDDPIDLYGEEEEEEEGEAPDAAGAGVSALRDLDDVVMPDALDLEEEAKLSLVIQYSIESSQWTSQDEEEQIQKALKLSKQDEGLDQLNEAINASLEEAAKATNAAHLHMFATQASSLMQAEAAFKEMVSQRHVVEKLDHSAAGVMTEYHRKCLEAIERKHGVEVEVEGTVISISGFRKFVSEAMCDMTLLINRMSQSVSQEEILQTVQWVFHHPIFTSTTPYSPEVTVFLENAWRMEMTKVDLLLDNQRHVVDFREMKDHNTASGESVTISRESLSSEAEAANDTEAADGCQVPSEKKPRLLAQLPNTTRVAEDSSEFRSVTEAFMRTARKYCKRIAILQVDKLQNQLLYHQYQLKRMSVQQDATDQEFERILYHGTSEDTVKEICLHGFNRSFCGKNATAYGQGVYFAVDSALSLQNKYSPPNADGHKFVFVSRVLTGNYTKGCHSMKAAPLKQGSDLPFRYDSVTDNVSDPGIFVIFNDTQAFPEYLVRCENI